MRVLIFSNISMWIILINWYATLVVLKICNTHKLSLNIKSIQRFQNTYLWCDSMHDANVWSSGVHKPILLHFFQLLFVSRLIWQHLKNVKENVGLFCFLFRSWSRYCYRSKYFSEHHVLSWRFENRPFLESRR